MEKVLKNDPLFEDALKTIVEHKICSASLLQRKLKISYLRASNIILEMEEKDYVGPFNGAKPREIKWDNIDE